MKTKQSKLQLEIFYELRQNTGTADGAAPGALPQKPPLRYAKAKPLCEKLSSQFALRAKNVDGPFSALQVFNPRIAEQTVIKCRILCVRRFD